MSQITYRYAKALYESAEEANCIAPVYQALLNLRSLIQSSPELKDFIYNPLMTEPERALILEHTFKDKIPDLLFKFLLFINEKKRLSLLSEMIQSFDELYLEKNNQIRVSLQTPFVLQNDQMTSIQQKLKNIYNKEIELQHEIKPELLGGFRLLAAGTLYDGSVKNQLDEFRQKVLI